MQNGMVYASAVYEPFNGAAPSEYVDGKIPDRIKRAKSGWVDRPDDRPAQTSPVGEPLILAVFALLFGGIIAVRRKNKEASRH